MFHRGGQDQLAGDRLGEGGGFQPALLGFQLDGGGGEDGEA